MHSAPVGQFPNENSVYSIKNFKKKGGLDNIIESTTKNRFGRDQNSTIEKNYQYFHGQKMEATFLHFHS